MAGGRWGPWSPLLFSKHPGTPTRWEGEGRRDRSPASRLGSLAHQRKEVGFSSPAQTSMHWTSQLSDQGPTLATRPPRCMCKFNTGASPCSELTPERPKAAAQRPQKVPREERREQRPNLGPTEIKAPGSARPQALPGTRPALLTLETGWPLSRGLGGAAGMELLARLSALDCQANKEQDREQERQRGS